MKKFCFLSVFVLAFFIYSTSGFAYSNNERPKFQFLVSGGFGFSYNKEMFDLVDNATDYMVGQVISGYGSAETELSLGSFFPVGYDVDLRYFMTDNFGFGLEIGSHTAKAKSTANVGSGSYKGNATLELTVVPVIANLYYRFDSDSSNSFMLLGAGVGYHFGKIKFDVKDDGTVVGHESYSGKQSKIGFQFIAEYDYVFDFGLTLFIGSKFKILEFDKFDGSLGDELAAEDEKLKAGLTGVFFYLGAGYSF